MKENSEVYTTNIITNWSYLTIAIV